MATDRVLLLALALAGCGEQVVARASGAAPVPDTLAVVRGAFEQRLVLTGEVDAAVSVHLSGPRTDDWNLAIRWLAEDGAEVHAGDRVASFDNVGVTDRLKELELAVIEAANASLEQQAKDAVAIADKAFAVEKERIGLAKAELDASVPATLLSRREAQTFALAKARSEVAFATATAELKATVDGSKHEAAVKAIAEDKAVRKLEIARLQLDGLDLEAPRDGTVLVGMHPFEGRRLQVGDNIWPGLTVVRLPDLSEMVVRARLDDVDDGRVHPGMAVHCVVDAFPDRPLRGHVAVVGAVAQELAQQSTRRYFDVRIELDETDFAVLRPGLSVRVEVVTRTIDDAVLAPRAGLDLGASPVVARLADGTEVEVEIDACDAQRCAIAAGLAGGEQLRATEGSR